MTNNILEITKEQDEIVKQLIAMGQGEGKDMGEIKGKLLETHVKTGWKGTPAEALDSLELHELGVVLFGEYKVKEVIYKYQEFKVKFTLNKHTKIENTVSRFNQVKLKDSEVINTAIENLKSLNINVSSEDNSPEVVLVKKDLKEEDQ